MVHARAIKAIYLAGLSVGPARLYSPQVHYTWQRALARWFTATDTSRYEAMSWQHSSRFTSPARRPSASHSMVLSKLCVSRAYRESHTSETKYLM